MDLQRIAKIQREQDLEPSMRVGERFLAGDPPPLTRQEEASLAGSPDSDAGAGRLEKIRNRAYALWLGDGQCHGRDQEHWSKAEREIEAEEKTAGPIM